MSNYINDINYEKVKILFFILIVLTCCVQVQSIEVSSTKYKYLTNDIKWKVYIEDEECIEPCKNLVEICVTGDTVINVTFEAGGEIILFDGFQVQSGGTFLAKPGTCIVNEY